MEIAEKLHARFGDKEWNDFAACTEETKAALKKLKLKPSAPQLKQILDAVSWRDPPALPIVTSECYIEADTKEELTATPIQWISGIVSKQPAKIAEALEIVRSRRDVTNRLKELRSRRPG